MSLRDLLMAAVLATFSTSPLAQATSDPSAFRYDHQLARDLGGAYAHSLARRMAGKSQLEPDFSSPAVVARVFKGDRHLVQISFGSDQRDSWVVVVLEQCKETGLLTVVDSGYWKHAHISPVEEFSHSDPSTFYAAPDPCSAADSAP